MVGIFIKGYLRKTWYQLMEPRGLELNKRFKIGLFFAYSFKAKSFERKGKSTEGARLNSKPQGKLWAALGIWSTKTEP